MTEAGEVAVRAIGSVVLFCVTWGVLLSVSCGDQESWDRHSCKWTTQRLEALPREMVLEGMVACRIVGEPDKAAAIRKYLKGGRKL